MGATIVSAPTHNAAVQRAVSTCVSPANAYVCHGATAANTGRHSLHHAALRAADAAHGRSQLVGRARCRFHILPPSFPAAAGPVLANRLPPHSIISKAQVTPAVIVYFATTTCRHILPSCSTIRSCRHNKFFTNIVDYFIYHVVMLLSTKIILYFTKKLQNQKLITLKENIRTHLKLMKNNIDIVQKIL